MFGNLNEEKKSGLVYSAAAVLPILLSLVFIIVVSAAGLTKKENFETQEWYLYCSFLLPQIGFAAVAAGYLIKTKTPVKTIAGKCRFRYFLIAVTLQIGLLSLSELNGWFLRFLGRFGYRSEINIPSLDGAGLFGVLFVVALLPAVFEETIFRGLLLKGLKGFGECAAVLVCGALFSLYHQNPAQTVYQFVCGAAFALVALRAGSILPTVFAHFLNNAFVILLQRFQNGVLPSGAKVPVLVFSVVCLVASIVFFFFDGRARKKTQTHEQSEKADKKGFFLSAAVGIGVCIIMWISALISGIVGG